MIPIIITELEYQKGKEVFAAAKDFQCIPAPPGEAELAASVLQTGAKYVIIGVNKYDNQLYHALPKGGVIVRFGVGHDGVDKRQAFTKGIYCVNTPGCLDASVAEYAMALMLSSARHIPVCAAENRHGNWKPRMGVELSGKTLTIIGCGAIGRRTAAIAAFGFGMLVVGFDRIALVDQEECGISRFTRDYAHAVNDADFVSLHIPDLPELRNFINAASLEAMPEKAILINTARGSLVDEDALYDAILAGRITGAALDVFKGEPYVPQSPGRDLRNLKNVIMAPHLGSSTRDACRRMACAALANIKHAVAGEYERMSTVT